MPSKQNCTATCYLPAKYTSKFPVKIVNSVNLLWLHVLRALKRRCLKQILKKTEYVLLAKPIVHGLTFFSLSCLLFPLCWSSSLDTWQWSSGVEMVSGEWSKAENEVRCRCWRQHWWDNVTTYQYWCWSWHTNVTPPLTNIINTSTII